jgi:hypothetical protein
MKNLLTVSNFSSIKDEILNFITDWTIHEFSQGNTWTGTALRSSNGKVESLYYGSNYEDTPLMSKLSHTSKFLQSLRCDKGRVRILKLDAKAVIRPHNDGLIFPDYTVLRLQVPIVTNPYVEYEVAGKRYSTEAGNLYYFDANLIHAVYNNSNESRISLVIDTIENEWLKELVEKSTDVNAL